MGRRWWTSAAGLPPSAAKGLPALTAKEVRWARVNLILIPLMAVVAAVVFRRWYLLIVALPPYLNLLVITPASHRRTILGLDK